MMWKITLYNLFIQMVSVLGSKCQCGTPSDNVLTMRIVGGRRAEPHSFPWAVAILRDGRMHCGGAIITNKHVLSAGHCFKWDKFQRMVVLISLDDLNNLEDVERRNISDVVIHEHFTSTPVRDENDIAIATMDEPVEFTENVKPVCLPTPKQDFSNRVATIVGWGRLGQSKDSSMVLMKASIRIQSDEECMGSKLAEHIVSATMMCAYYKGRDGCQGDSGGPLVTFESDERYVQAGIVSWGVGCADPRYPGVYTKVSQYIDWIKRHTRDGQTCN